MTNKALSVLAIITAILLAISFVVAGDQPTVQFEFVSGRNLIPDIDTARVHQIEIEGWGKKTTLERQGDRYVVANRNNYPADPKVLSALVRACLKVRCDEKITESPERHADLNVDWPSGRAHRVRFSDVSGTMLVGLIVSNVIPGKAQGNHVRLIGSDTVYRTDNNIAILADPVKFLFKKFIPVDVRDIARVDVIHAEHFAILQDAEGNTSMKGVPEDMQPVKTFANMLAQIPLIEFEDFTQASERPGLKFDATFQVEMRAKIRYRLRIAKDGENYWVIASAEYFGPKSLASLNLDRNASIEQVREADGYRQASNAANAYNQQHSGRVYQVHARFGFYLTQRVAPLLEKKSK